MKTALILGINGGFGGYVAQALTRQGWQIRTLMRDPAKLPERFKGITVIKGDASNIDDVRRASQTTELMVYGVNPANYDWKNKALPWLKVSATVAEEKGLTLVFPGNVYVLNPQQGPEFNEASVIEPVSAKGKIRQAMEARLETAGRNGAKVIILRCGDFIGKNTASTWFQHLIKTRKAGYSLAAPGAADLIHSWAYLPDVARAVTEILKQSDQLAAFTVFHFKGQQFSCADLARTLARVSGKEVVIKKFPWQLIHVLGVFSKLYAGIYEMRYLWNTEINLDDTRLKMLLKHDCNITPLDEILRENVI